MSRAISGKPLRSLIFMGTPEFAVKPLAALLAAGYPVSLVATRPDSPRDRGKRLQPSPVKEFATRHGLPVFTPDNLKRDKEAVARLAAVEPDLIVVAAYGLILPPSVLALPTFGCVNIHASLLPRHRGAAPIQRAILAGDETTGVTLMHMSEGLDEGDMIARRETPIGRKNAGELTDEMAALGTALLLEIIPELMDGRADRRPQDAAFATYAPPVQKAEARLDFARPARQLERQIQAMCPQPGAFLLRGDDRLKIFAAEASDEAAPPGSRPGQVLAVDRSGIVVATGDRTLRLTRIQAPGKKAVDVGDFLKGNQIEIGLQLR